MFSYRVMGREGANLLRAISEQDDLLSSLASSDMIFIPLEDGDQMIGGKVEFGPSKRDDVKVRTSSNEIFKEDEIIRVGGDVLADYPFAEDIPRPLSFSSITDKVIVLDLDETLVHSYAHPGTFQLYYDLGMNKINDLSHRIYLMQIRDALNTPEHPRGRGEVTNIWGVIRPHAREFLLFCFSYFKAVIVWSAGTKKYVHEIVKIIFNDMPQPHVVLTRDDCTKIDDYHDKNLNKLFGDETLKRYAKPENTLIIDDREVSFSTCPNNGVIIPEYKPSPSIANMKSDNIALLQLRSWFLREDIRDAVDVRQLNKDRDAIFTYKIQPTVRKTALPIDLSDVYSTIQSDRKMIQVY